MTRLFLTELRRYRSRRAVQGAGLVIVAIIAIASTIVFFNSKNDPAAIAAGDQERERFVRTCIRDFDRFAGELPPGYDSVEEFCTEGSPRSVSDPRFHLESLTGLLGDMSPLIVIFAVGLGATFIGAEWGAGTVTTFLTWEPRRIRVLIAKALAAAAFVFVAALGVQALLGSTLAAVAGLRGSMEGVDASWFADTAGLALRSSVVAALLATIGFSLASVARNTGLSVFIGFVYFAILESIIRAFRPNWTPWLVGDNAALFVAGRESVFLGSTHSATRALMTILVYAALCIAASALVFHRRDVT